MWVEVRNLDRDGMLLLVPWYNNTFPGSKCKDFAKKASTSENNKL